MVVTLVTSSVLNGVVIVLSIVLVHGESGEFLTRCFQPWWNLVTIFVCWDGICSYDSYVQRLIMRIYISTNHPLPRLDTFFLFLALDAQAVQWGRCNLMMQQCFEPKQHTQKTESLKWKKNMLTNASYWVSTCEDVSAYLRVFLFEFEKVSERQKNSHFPLYWLFQRDPYTVMVYCNPHITG